MDLIEHKRRMSKLKNREVMLGHGQNYFNLACAYHFYRYDYFMHQVNFESKDQDAVDSYTLAALVVSESR